MFTRIMAVVLTVILLLTGVLSSIGWVALRRQQAGTVLEELRQEAREIAWLASQQPEMQMPVLPLPGAGMTFLQTDFPQLYLQHRAQDVYEKYGAYILVVDRTGRIMDNKNAAFANNPAFAAMLDADEVNASMAQVLQGEEIELHITVDGNDYFTVAVPYVQNDEVLGAVFVQTPAQVISGGAEKFILPVVGMTVLVSLVAGMVLFFYLRGVMKPLTRLTQAATAMAGGDFDICVPDARTTPEVAELSEAFNIMAEQLSRMEDSRREFVANVSHELRSPITAIRGYVDGMLDGTIPGERQTHYLTIVSSETKRLSKLIGELLDLSRLEREDAALEMTDFDVCDLLERAFLRRMGDIDARGLELECDFDPEPCYVRADLARIEQVATNLIDNAIKFTPDGGRIDLIVRQEAGVCTVTVKDSGIGILPEDRPKVFDRFYTADKAHTSGKGTGLGLSICQRIMEMHEQQIRLLETEGGAAFAFTLAAGERHKRPEAPSAEEKTLPDDEEES